MLQSATPIIRRQADAFDNKLKKLGIRYEYAVQYIDSSPEWQMMEGMLASMAAYYSRNIAKETKKGLHYTQRSTFWQEQYL